MAEYVNELRDSLSENATDQDAAKWWTLVELMESSIARDIESNKSLKGNVRYLRSTVTDLIAARRDGLNPNYIAARVAVSALASKIAPRTALDGWKGI
ncbi:hypothetical protein [Sphingorhabdus sp.]|uniref:hypothetical protein n=1 Tax=Sphingorhabdus sp. TaxID=1902408 RepID=UPI0039837FA6